MSGLSIGGSKSVPLEGVTSLLSQLSLRQRSESDSCRLLPAGDEDAAGATATTTTTTPAAQRCSVCMTATTQQWRFGPPPKRTLLCNACGLRLSRRLRQREAAAASAVATAVVIEPPPIPITTIAKVPGLAELLLEAHKSVSPEPLREAIRYFVRKALPERPSALLWSAQQQEEAEELATLQFKLCWDVLVMVSEEKLVTERIWSNVWQLFLSAAEAEAKVYRSKANEEDTSKKSA